METSIRAYDFHEPIMRSVIYNKLNANADTDDNFSINYVRYVNEDDFDINTLDKNDPDHVTIIYDCKIPEDNSCFYNFKTSCCAFFYSAKNYIRTNYPIYRNRMKSSCFVCFYSSRRYIFSNRVHF